MDLVRQFLIKEGFLKYETKFPTQSTTNSKLNQQVLKKNLSTAFYIQPLSDHWSYHYLTLLP